MPIPPSDSAPGPLVSVIMNGFNSARYLAEALESLLAQTYSNWELVFWDNRSEDNSEDIVRSFADPRIHFHRADKRMPLAEGRNRAVERAGGKWIAFLDCDDLWLPQKLAMQIERLRLDGGSDVGLVYGRTLSFSARGVEGETTYRYYGRALPEGNIAKALLLEGNLVPMVSAMVLRKAYAAVGAIPAHLTFAEDYWLFVAIATTYRTLCVQEVCCRYRVHAGSATHRNKLASHVESLEVLLRWRACLEPRELKRRVAVYHTLIGIEELRAGRCEGLANIVLRGSFPFLLRGTISTAVRRFVRRQRPYA